VDKHLDIQRPLRYTSHWPCAHLVGPFGRSPARVPGQGRGVLRVCHVLLLLLRVFVGLKLAVVEHTLNPFPGGGSGAPIRKGG
jgi:hypothetical protein